MTLISPSAFCILILLIRTDVTFGLKCHVCAGSEGLLNEPGVKSCDEKLAEPLECSPFTKGGPEREAMGTSLSLNGTGEPQLQADLSNRKYVCSKSIGSGKTLFRGCLDDDGKKPEGCEGTGTNAKICFCRTDGCNGGRVNSLTGSLYGALGLGILTSGLTTLNF